MLKKITILSLLIVTLLNIITSCKGEPLTKFYEAEVLLPTKDTLLLVLEVSEKSEEAFTGYLTIPKYRQYRLSLDECLVVGDSISFKYAKFDFAFKGKYSPSTIEGTYRSGGDYHIIFNQVDLKKRRPQTPKSPFPYVTKEVSYHSKDSVIKYGGTLTLPDEKDKYPAVILLTGSGAQDRDETIFYHKPFFVLADYLTKRGFAVLRLDDRGVGGTTGGRLPNTTNDFANDALEAVDYLKRQKNVNATSIGFIGHSEGGLIAFIAASRSSDIAFIVSLASPGVSGKELSLRQLGQSLLAREKDTLTVNNVLKFWDKSFDLINKASSRSQMESSITRAFKEWVTAHQGSSKSLALMGFDFSDLSSQSMVDKFLGEKVKTYLDPWSRYLLSYNPHPYFSKLKTPILALNGDKDENVDADINLPRFRSLAERYTLQIDTVKIQNLNHFLQTTNNGSVTKVYENHETISVKVLDTVYQWINKHK